MRSSAEELFDRARSIMEASGLDEAIVANAVRDHLASSARADVVAGDLESAKAKAAQYQREAEAAKNRFQIFTAHRLNGLIAMAEERWQNAVTEQTNPQDSYDQFLRARALEGVGRSEEAAALDAEVARFNPLLTLEHAYVRPAAARRVAG